MNPIKVFLVCVFITALALCVAALIAGTPLLYNIGAVIAILTALVAMWPRILQYLNPEEEDQ